MNIAVPSTFVMNKNTKQIGDAGEDLAVFELEKAGYKIIERNFRTRFGEIDIIALDEDVLVFVEVKAKSSSMFGSPAEMVTAKKQFKIKKTAESYVLESGYVGPWRIDVVAIQNSRVEIIKNITI